VAQVRINVNGVGYAVTCDDGQEARVRDLASAFDERVQALAEQIGQVGDARLMLLAALTVCDELHEALAARQNAEARVADLDSASEDSAAKVLQAAAARVRAISARLDAEAG